MDEQYTAVPSVESDLNVPAQLCNKRTEYALHWHYFDAHATSPEPDEGLPDHPNRGESQKAWMT